MSFTENYTIKTFYKVKKTFRLIITISVQGMETAYVCGTRNLVENRQYVYDDGTPKPYTETDYTEHIENISINVRNFHDHYSGKADEHMLDAIEQHISVPYDAEESVQAHQYAYGLIQYIVDKSQEIEPTLKMKIIESGSFFSNLRVGLPYEFDFMLDITSTFSDGESDYGYSVEKILDSDTFMYRIHSNINGGIFKNEQKYLNSIAIKKLLFGLFNRVIGNPECNTKWRMSRYDTDHEENTSSTAFRISLYYKDTAILIDLVPCLKFPAADMGTELPQLQHTTELLLKTLLGEEELRMYLHNLPEQIYLVCKSYRPAREGLFKLSTSHIEKDLYLNHLDHKCLQALKIAKYYFQIFFFSLYDAKNVNTFGRPSNTLGHLELTNAHPFSSKSYLPSYMITNLFFHFLKIVMWFPGENSDESSFCKDIVMMFIKFVHTIIGYQMPVAISNRNKWDMLDITIHGWCFCNTNPITVKFTDYMHSYFRNSMAKYIKVLENTSNEFELRQFPLVGRKPEAPCPKCFDQNFYSRVMGLSTDIRFKWGECQLHGWSHQKELLALPPPRD